MSMARRPRDAEPEEEEEELTDSQYAHFDQYNVVYNDEKETWELLVREEDSDDDEDRPAGDCFANVVQYFIGLGDVEMARQLLHSPFREFQTSSYWRNPDSNGALSISFITACSQPKASASLRLCLQEGADMLDITETGLTALSVATREGTVLSVASILGDLGSWTSIAHIILFQACYFQNVEMARLMLREPGIRLNEPCGACGSTCLYNCGDNPELIDALLLHPGIDVNARCPEMRNCTPLLFAAGGHPQGASFPNMLIALLKHEEVDVNAVDKYGRSALMYACARNDRRAVEALLSRPELRVDLVDHMGNTAVDIVMRNDDHSLLSLLSPAGLSDELGDVLH